jgi:hypothetical protein
MYTFERQEDEKIRNTKENEDKIRIQRSAGVCAIKSDSKFTLTFRVTAPPVPGQLTRNIKNVRFNRTGQY